MVKSKPARRASPGWIWRLPSMAWGPITTVPAPEGLTNGGPASTGGGHRLANIAQAISATQVDLARGRTIRIHPSPRARGRLANQPRSDGIVGPGSARTNKRTRERAPVDLVNEHLSASTRLAGADCCCRGAYRALAERARVAFRPNASSAACFQCRLAPFRSARPSSNSAYDA